MNPQIATHTHTHLGEGQALQGWVCQEDSIPFQDGHTSLGHHSCGISKGHWVLCVAHKNKSQNMQILA